MVFREADPFQQAADALSRILDLELFEGKLHDGGLVVRVINFEIPRQTEPGGLPAQHPGAKGVERADPRIIKGKSLPDQQVADALLHLSRRLIREGNGKDRAARHALLDEVSDAIRNGARFSRPRTGENQDRAFQCCRGFALSGIQFVKESHDGERAC